MSHSISDRLPATNPPTQPSALLSVPTRTGIALFDAEVLGHAASVRAENARGVGFVDQQHRLVALGQVGQFGQRGQVAVHAEQAIGHDQPPPIPPRFGQAAMPSARQSLCG